MSVGAHSQPPPAPLSRGEVVLLAGALLVAAALRFGDIPIHNFAPDEGYSVELAGGSWSELIRKTADDTHPPFYYALLKVWFLAAPATLNSAKCLSVLFGVGTLAAVFVFTRRMFGNTAAGLALAWAAISPYQIYWTHVARMHQVLPLFVILVVHFSYRFAAEGGTRLWAMLALAWVGAVQTDYMALVFGVVWGAAFLFERMSLKRRAAFYATGLIGLVSLAYWFPVLLRQMDVGPANRNFFQETVSPVYLYYHSLFGTMEPYQPNQTGWQYVMFVAFAVVAVFGGLAVRARWSFWVLLLASPTLPIIVAKWQHWTLAERHLLFTVPVFMAYWGAACPAAWKEYQRRFGKGEDDFTTEAQRHGEKEEETLTTDSTDEHG